MMYQTSAAEKSNAHLTIVCSLKNHRTQPIYIFNKENPQNSESPNGPRRGLDFIALGIEKSMNLLAFFWIIQNANLAAIFFGGLFNKPKRYAYSAYASSAHSWLS